MKALANSFEKYAEDRRNGRRVWFRTQNRKWCSREPVPSDYKEAERLAQFYRSVS